MAVSQAMMIGSVRIPVSIVISADTQNYNLFNSLPPGYVAGVSDVTVTIAGGVKIGSTSTAAYAFDTGLGWTTGDTIKIVNSGYIVGKGGDGAVPVVGNSGAGGDGGPALFIQYATSIDNSTGVIGGGGGGGGGGGYVPDNGGGGAGYDPGVTTGGTNATLTNGANARYYPTGGAGGAAGVAGASNFYGGGGGGLGANGGDGYTTLGGYGGAGGHAVDGNALATWLATGTRYGTIGA